jgi:hypothetical protein
VATLDIPNQYLEVGPIVVTSPTTRCGTTLAQRLLWSSDNAFVYGEEIGHQLNNLTDQFLTVIRYCEVNEAELDDGFRRALAGAMDDWRPGLAPPAEIMLKAWISTYYQLPATLAAFGGAIGRPLWGFKWPACPPRMLSAFLALMPRTRIIYLVRHPAEALKSAKARRFVKNTQEASSFCQTWAENLQAALPLRSDPRVLWLRYEDLLAEKERAVADIEAFAGVRGIRMEAFGVKVNTFVGDPAEGHSPTQYIVPAALTEAELDAVALHAGALASELYPEEKWDIA